MGEMLLPKLQSIDGQRGEWSIRSPYANATRVVRVRLSGRQRIVVVGAGKAAAGMAQGLLKFLRQARREHPRWMGNLQIQGRVNVPDPLAQQLALAGAGTIDCVGVRAEGENIPTQRAFESTRLMAKMVGDCGPTDILIALISGGGSALLVAPRAGVSVADKALLVQKLSARGIDIQNINSIRRELSAVKAGGLARLGSAAGQRVGLILSDVVGNPLELVASGPTVVPRLGSAARAANALQTLQQIDSGREIPVTIYDALQRQASSSATLPEDSAGSRGFENLLVGDLQVAVKAAASVARLQGWTVTEQWAEQAEGDVGPLADRFVYQLAKLAQKSAETRQTVCWISGGEPTVQLAACPGRGGRNQQLVLLVLQRLRDLLLQNWPTTSDPALTGLQKWLRLPAESFRFCLIAAGTDGEDGVTPYAGAWLDETKAAAGMFREDLDHCISHNDAASFVEQLGAVWNSGPTHTNVGDLRVIAVAAGGCESSDGRAAHLAQFD